MAPEDFPDGAAERRGTCGVRRGVCGCVAAWGRLIRRRRPTPLGPRPLAGPVHPQCRLNPRCRANSRCRANPTESLRFRECGRRRVGVRPAITRAVGSSWGGPRGRRRTARARRGGRDAGVSDSRWDVSRFDKSRAPEAGAERCGPVHRQGSAPAARASARRAGPPSVAVLAAAPGSPSASPCAARRRGARPAQRARRTWRAGQTQRVRLTTRGRLTARARREQRLERDRWMRLPQRRPPRPRGPRDERVAREPQDPARR